MTSSYKLADFDPETGHLRDCCWSEVAFSPLCDKDCTEQLYAGWKDAEAFPAPGAPPRPDLHLDDAGPVIPDGWSGVVIGRDTDGDEEVVLAGWDSAGEFWQYASTEVIVSACRAAIEHLIYEGTPHA